MEIEKQTRVYTEYTVKYFEYTGILRFLGGHIHPFKVWVVLDGLTVTGIGTDWKKW